MKKLLILVSFLIATNLFAQVVTNQGKDIFVQLQPVTQPVTQPITKYETKHIKHKVKHIKHKVNPTIMPVTKCEVNPITTVIAKYAIIPTIMPVPMAASSSTTTIIVTPDTKSEVKPTRGSVTKTIIKAYFGYRLFKHLRLF
jgi:hypothetical protein